MPVYSAKGLAAVSSNEERKFKDFVSEGGEHDALGIHALDLSQSGAADKHPEAMPWGAETTKYDETLRMADTFLFQDEPREALRYYSRAAMMERDRVEPWVGQVLAHLFQANNKEALTWAKGAMTAHPDDPGVIALHGLTLVLTGSTDKGLARSDQSIRIGAQESLCWTCRAWIFLHLRKRGKWAKCFSKAQDLRDSGDWQPHAQMAYIFERYGKWKQAAACYERAAADYPIASFLWLRLETCYKKMFQPRKAQAALRFALNPEQALAHVRKSAEARNRPSGTGLFGMLRRMFGAAKRRGGEGG